MRTAERTCLRSEPLGRARYLRGEVRDGERGKRRENERLREVERKGRGD